MVYSYKKKRRQDRDWIHEAWLTSRFEHTDTPDPTTQSLYCGLGEALIKHSPFCVPKA